MKRWVAAVVLMAMCAVAAVSWAERADQSKPYAATKVRIINAGNEQRWDTLTTVGGGMKFVLLNFQAFLHDSNAVAGFRAVFSSLNNATTYLVIKDTLATAGQFKMISLAGPIAFPSDSTIKVTYYMTNGVADSLYAVPTFRVERAP